MIKKHASRLGILIFALIMLGAVAFAFSQPTLAPGFNLHLLGGEFADNISDSTNTFATPEKKTGIGKDVQANSFLIYDEGNGQIIASKNPQTTLAIASLTKLMTTFVVHKYGNLTDTWAITPDSTNDTKPVLGLEVGDRVIVNDLENAMLIGSANDAAASLGQYMSSIKNQPMVDIMNAEAKSLGMNSTHYENPIGFDSEQNYSTAEDLKLLLDKLHPQTQFANVDRKQSYSFTSLTGKSYSVKATNKLIGLDPEIHAIKTGYTDEANGAMITAVYHNDFKFIIIVLDSPNREKDTQTLKSQVIDKIGK